MKKLLLFIAGVFYLSVNVFSQTDSAVSKPDSSRVTLTTKLPDGRDTTMRFEKVEIEAAFPGGLPAWGRYIGQNINGNVPYNNNAPVGTYQVMIELIVNTDGSVGDIKLLTHYGYGMEHEAMRVISNSPKWEPAFQDGRNVRAYRMQPITFRVEKN
jgi:periplasmic protein TonB